jgi:hypothetical protein
MADVNICKKDTNARVEHLRQIQFLKVTGFQILAFFLVITVLLRAKTTNNTTHNPKPSTFSIIQQSQKLKKQKKNRERGFPAHQNHNSLVPVLELTIQH